jgi:predicted secreted protein
MTYFLMVCFATNSVAQPTGRMLGLPYPHSAIFRSSPFLCGFDAVHILAHWLAEYISACWSERRLADFRLAATRALMYRIIDDDDEPDIKAARRIKQGAHLRWAGFLLTVLPALIKLFASRGIPWSQAFGTMFLASWLVFEILVLSARLENDDDDDAAAPLIEPPAQPHQTVIVLHTFWAAVAILIHASVFSLPARTVIQLIQGTPIGFTGWLGLISNLLSYSLPLWIGSFFRLDIRASTARLMGAAIALFIAPPFDRETIEWYYVVPFVFICLVQAEIVVFFFHNRRGQVLVFMQLLCVVVRPVLFYTLLYDPVGTYQPAWFKWLG